VTERRPTPEGVSAAAGRIAGQITRTPLLGFEWEGRSFFAKAECLQQGGSFKLRGATNRLRRLSREDRDRGVVAFSSGNHGLGVAIAAQRLGMAAAIVIPTDAPAAKRDAVLAAGAEIIAYDRKTEDRVAIGERIAAETGATLVPSFDDVDVIEGQGTVGIEIGEQMEALTGGNPDTVIVPCGGGGLSAGIALALPNAKIVTVEPEGWDDMARSIDAGSILPVSPDAPATIADALQTPRVSPLTFDVLCGRARAVAVGDRAIEAAMAFAARRLRLVVEPGGAIALAALLSGKAGALGGRTVVVLSGGNVDLARYAEMLASVPVGAIR
jgi:threonine dehydratase